MKITFTRFFYKVGLGIDCESLSNEKLWLASLEHPWGVRHNISTLCTFTSFNPSNNTTRHLLLLSSLFHSRKCLKGWAFGESNIIWNQSDCFQRSGRNLSAVWETWRILAKECQFSTVSGEPPRIWSKGESCSVDNNFSDWISQEDWEDTCRTCRDKWVVGLWEGEATLGAGFFLKEAGCTVAGSEDRGCCAHHRTAWNWLHTGLFNHPDALKHPSAGAPASMKGEILT